VRGDGRRASFVRRAQTLCLHCIEGVGRVLGDASTVRATASSSGRNGAAVLGDSARLLLPALTSGSSCAPSLMTDENKEFDSSVDSLSNLQLACHELCRI
jgi:hypothetical protein